MNENEHLCDYGCGQVAVFQCKNGKWCCSSVISKCPAQRNNMSKKTKHRHAVDQQSFLNAVKLDCNDNHICSYGCGKPASYRFGNGKYCCQSSYVKCPAIIGRSRLKIRDAWKNGSYDNTDFKSKDPNKLKRSIITRQKISKTLSQKTVLHDKAAGRCKRYVIENNQHTEFSVQGTWEFNIAKRMNNDQIFWIRRSPLKYLKDGNIHYYHPDFFIPSKNIYVEVKGYFSEENRVKMNLVIEYNPNVKIAFIDSVQYHLLMNQSSYSVFDVPFYTKR